jgi:HAD superfamily hydrolase (TIGR01549 family)
VVEDHNEVMAHLRPGVLFDVDGTLVDSNYLHALSWSRALRDAGEWAPMNAIHRLVGMGGDQLVTELIGHKCPSAQDARPKHYDELKGDMLAFPYAASLLRRIRGLGLGVVLATSAPEDELRLLRELLNADDAIDAQTSADDVATAKPDPEVFLTAMATGGIDPERVLAVGDSVWDIKAARAAGIGCIAVESGGFSRHELSESGALFVYRDVKELLDQLHTSPIRGLLR